ncbi:MAG: caspase family protein [Bacteroidota bacterium]
MKQSIHIKDIRNVMLLVLFTACRFLQAQEAESKTVVFHLNNVPDREAPVISILSPSPGAGERFVSELDKVEVIGEVTDASRIRFVSVNTDIKLVGQTGMFASSVSLVPGENLIRVKSMDEHSNMKEIVLYVDYAPPVLTLADKIKKNSKYFGLIIGIDTYKDPGIPDLDNPIRDAQSIFHSLTTNYTFEPENITMLKNPKRSDIIRELDALRGKVSKEDNLLIFYAGHGYWDEDASIGYWLPSDATRETTADWFRNSTLVNYLQAIHSKHTLLITDACFAGSIFKSRSVILDMEVVYDRIYEIPSRKAMTSGAMTEVPDNSAFVKYLVKQLDENKETYLSSEELFSSFRMAVISNSSVLPQYGEIQNVGNEGGDFIFLKRGK